MELDILFVREKVLGRSLIITHILTKPLSHVRFCHLHNKLNVLDYFQEP